MFTRIKENKADSFILIRGNCLNGFSPVHYVLEFFVLRKMVQRFEFRKIRIALHNFQFQIFGIGKIVQFFQFQIFCLALQNFQFPKFSAGISVSRILFQEFCFRNFFIAISVSKILSSDFILGILVQRFLQRKICIHRTKKKQGRPVPCTT